jgi:hypothetical protein
LLESRDEVSRISSPSGILDAVLIETNGGATASFGYEVRIVPKGKKYNWGVEVASLYGAIRNEHAYGANLRWETPQKIVIEYYQSKTADLLKNKVKIKNQIIEVSLRGGVVDSSAPSGGMLYNLKK